MTTLSDYVTATQNLLQNPAASTSLYSQTNLITYINTARNQLAGETECVRAYGALQLAYGTAPYAFSAIVPGISGTSGVYNVRGMTIQIASGSSWMNPRPFPYFQFYFLNNPVPSLGVPTTYSQFGQGENGTLYVNPVPDYNYIANVDVVCVPSALVNTTDVDAVIPYPYSDAVPYYAAYLAYMSAQRAGDAERMWAEYQKFAARGRQMSNGEVNPAQYPQNPNPTRAGQLGMSGGGGAR